MGTTLLIVRHAAAGDRQAWEGPDERRPLTGKGRRQAAGLVGLLTEHAIDRVLSSWYLRCLETIAPLAGERRLGIELDPALAEGSSVSEIAGLVDSLVGTRSVLCTHGDVVCNALGWLRGLGVSGIAADPPMAKASTWVFGGGDSGWDLASYLLPPA